jgi:uncharacterized protein with HEPN domain
MTSSDIPRELFWLQDIYAAIEKIETHPQFLSGRAAFDQDEHYRVWVFYHIERIGECVSRLRKEHNYDKQHPDIDWKAIVGMRRHLVHWYWGVESDKIWDGITQDMPQLKEKIVTLLHQKKKSQV